MTTRDIFFITLYYLCLREVLKNRSNAIEKAVRLCLAGTISVRKNIDRLEMLFFHGLGMGNLGMAMIMFMNV